MEIRYSNLGYFIDSTNRRVPILEKDFVGYYGNAFGMTLFHVELHKNEKGTYEKTN